MRQPFISVVATGILASQLSGQLILDFETYFDPDTNTTVDFQRGEEVTDQYAYLGVNFSGQRRTGSGLVDHELWIFDTDLPTQGGSSGNDGDRDLISNGYGPGNSGTDHGNILVVQERTNEGDIPDDNARGGVIKVTFDTPVLLHSLGALDIERRGKTAIIGFDSNDNEVFNFTGFTNYGDNSYNLVEFDENQIHYLIFDHRGSGAITGLEFTPVPEPATIASLSVVGLGALLVIRRRFIKKRALSDPKAS